MFIYSIIGSKIFSGLDPSKFLFFSHLFPSHLTIETIFLQRKEQGNSSLRRNNPTGQVRPPLLPACKSIRPLNFSHLVERFCIALISMAFCATASTRRFSVAGRPAKAYGATLLGLEISKMILRKSKNSKTTFASFDRFYTSVGSRFS